MSTAGGHVEEHLGSRVHRALSSPARSRLLALLRDEGRPLDARGLADRVGLHLSTVRAHLAVLQDADLVRSRSEERDRPGRPRRLYEASGDPREPAARDYRFLADVLAGHVAEASPEPSEEAARLGARWGRHLVEGPPPGSVSSPAAALARIVDLLDGLGFEPELDDADAARPRMLLRRCPFLQVARRHQEVVCALHLGLVEGALEELATAVEVVDLVPFAEPQLCVSHLALTGGSRTRRPGVG